MTNFNLSECEVLSVLKRRYNVTPTTIEPWFNSGLFILDAVGQQLRTWVWRFNLAPEIDGIISGGVKFPFFVGDLSLDFFQTTTTPSIPDHWIATDIRTIGSIGSDYNLVTERIKAYGDGTTFLGPLLPTFRMHEVIQEKLIITPFMTVKVNIGLVGEISISLAARFSGYIIYL